MEIEIRRIPRNARRPSPISLNRALEGRKVSENLSTQLARADLKVTVGEFLALQVMAALGIGVGGYFLFRHDRAWRFWRL